MTKGRKVNKNKQEIKERVEKVDKLNFGKMKKGDKLPKKERRELRKK